MSDPTQQEHGLHMFHDEADEQHKRDMEQLGRFGYQQDLRRSLGFFSNFAIAFSFISATNGFYALFYYGLDVGGPAGLFWAWPIVVFGQFMVCLVFAEAASHYPLAGDVYQWAKRFMGGTYGWFAAWAFAWALLATIAAIAFGAAPIVCSLFGWDANSTSNLFLIALFFTLGPMVLNMYSVKIAAFFNNIGTVTEIIGLVVISIALYIAVIFGKGEHQSIGVIFDTGGTAVGHAWGYGGAFLAAMLTSAWVLYGFHAAGGLAEETVNPTRSVPRAMIFAVGITAVISAFWLFAMVLAIPDVTKTQAQTTNAIAYIFDAHFAHWVTNVFLVAVLTAIFVCCLAVQVATTRLLFAYGRDKMIPASRFFGFVSLRTKTPLLSAAFVAVATIAILIYVNFGGSAPGVSIARVTAWATAGTYVVYQMVVFASMLARSRGYPKERAYFNLGRWGWPVSIAGFVYGVFMIINLSWPRTPTAAWYDNYLVIFSIGMVFALGVIVYLIQRARGVDLAATIHELVETPAEAPAAEAEMPGPVGATSVSEAGTLEMAADEGTGMGSVSVDPPSGPQEPGGPQI